MRTIHCVGLVLLTGVLIGTAQADSVSMSDPFTYNGCAQNVSGVIRLTNPGGTVPGSCNTDANGNRNGSAFVSSPLAITANTSFAASFAYRIWGGDAGNGADGLVFVLQNDPRGASAAGAGGNDQGYSGQDNVPQYPAITPSWAVSIDTFKGNPGEPSGNYISFKKNGTRNDVPNLLYGTPTYDLNDGTTQFVWVDYSAITQILSVYASATNTKPLLELFSKNSDLTELGNQFYVGFTAGTGGLSNIHDIEQFSMTTTVVPIPGAALLFGSALGGLGWIRRRRVS